MATATAMAMAIATTATTAGTAGTAGTGTRRQKSGRSQWCETFPSALILGKRCVPTGSTWWPSSLHAKFGSKDVGLQRAAGLAVESPPDIVFLVFYKRILPQGPYMSCKCRSWGAHFRFDARLMLSLSGWHSSGVSV